ncbi:MAG: response regulator [Candidatus Hydrogenedentota bacterium]
MPPKKYIGTLEASKILHVDPSTIQRWIDSQLIPSHRTAGGHRRISLDDLQKFAAARHVPIDIAPDRPRILIVDDEPDVLETLRVRIAGFRPDIDVLTADQGFKAGFAVHQYRPTLVFLDIRMPGINGVHVCKLIKTDPSTRDIIVVGITASRDPHEIEALLRAGASSVLLKPIETDDLKNVLARTIPLALLHPSDVHRDRPEAAAS